MVNEASEQSEEIVVEQKGVTAERLSSLGFHQVATKIHVLKERKRKLMLAFEHFKYVSQGNVDTFNERLKKETLTGEGFNVEYKTLSFCAVEGYDKAPPADVLAKMEEAVAFKCFDSFEVAYIREVKDPLLFGRIKDCPLRFFIAQWDDDVKISDIISAKEG